MIADPRFYTSNPDTYPPFKQGRYLEEYVCQTLASRSVSPSSRKYIPALWTNFQICAWFGNARASMQAALDKWVAQHPSPAGYFTVVQHDDGPLLRLPANTVVYGACSGDIPIPLIYEDTRMTLERVPRRSFAEKDILCSFVGNLTANHVLPNVRREMFHQLSNQSGFMLINAGGGWSAQVKESQQQSFVQITSRSKFALAPRGYGRSSFRFFECFQLGAVPVYVWNDVEWLPFSDVIDYSKLCISIHVSKLSELPHLLSKIQEEEYAQMQHYYETVKHWYTLPGMTERICAMEDACKSCMFNGKYYSDAMEMEAAIKQKHRPPIKPLRSFLRFPLFRYFSFRHN